MSVERVSLAQAASYLLDECRMILPGIQALFGFQLVAVFNARFETALSASDQKLHYLSLALVALAAALVMAPAAYHRQTGPQEVSRRFIALASRLLLICMVPMALGVSLDFFLIGKMILHRSGLALSAAAVLFGAFAFLWLFLPRLRPITSEN